MYIPDSIIYSILFVIVGTVVGGIVGKLFSSDLPKVCKSWNKNHVMEISLFITGFVMYYLYAYMKKKMR